jgi:rubrerythrin
MNKQIEEMTKVIEETERKKMDTHCDLPSVEEYATDLYNAGYRKQRDGEWVLYKPRRENRNATYKCSVCGKLCSSYYNDAGEWKCCPHCGAKMKGGAE